MKDLSNCWICSHSPISSTSMSYVANPLPETELLDILCSDLIPMNLESPQGDTAVSLPVTGWIKYPWWQVNISEKIGTWYEYDATNDGWKTKPASILEVGEVPVTEIKISFSGENVRINDQTKKL